MPVLLLCYGEEGAKQLLRRAIEARYGINPPAIDKLVIDFEGRGQIKLGPLKTWVPFSSSAKFIFPTHLRWDYTIKPFKLPVQRGSEIFDGDQFYSTRNYKPEHQVDHEDLIESTRRRLWSMAAMLLTPLSEMYIKLTQLDEYSFTAENTVLGDSVRLTLDSDGKLVRTEVTCINPDTGRRQTYSQAFSPEQATVDDLMLPVNSTVSWDDDVSIELKPTRVDTSPDLTNNLFKPEVYNK